MNNDGKVWKGAAVLALGIAIAACGGGGGGSASGGNVSGGDDPGDGSDGGAGTLSGLTGDADNQDLLYFSHSYETGENPGTGQTMYRSVLYALDPANPEMPTALPLDTRDSAQGDDMGRSHYVPLYEANIDASDGSVSDYRVADVLFLHNRMNGSETSEGFARVGTEVGAPDPVRVSSETYLGAAVTGAGTLLRQNYSDSGDAAVVYGLPGNEKRVRMTFGPGDAPGSSGGGTVHHVVDIDAFGANDSLNRQTYLVLSDYGGTQCDGGYRLAMDHMYPEGGNSISNTNLLPGGREAKRAVPLGGPLNDGSQYLIIDTVIDTGIAGRPCLSEGGTLWRYDATQPFEKLVQVLDESNEPLVFPEGIAGGAVVPQERHLAREGGVLYFGIAELFGMTPQDIYRVEGESWSVLSEQEEPLGWELGFIIADEGRVVASAGNGVVSWNSLGGDRKVLDTTEADWSGSIQSEVLGSRDGWIFYTRAHITGRDDAVARKIDGSDAMVIEDARWIGASLSGKGDAIGDMTDLSEVFLETNDREIAAVSAADPKAGYVVLGQHNGQCEAGVCYSASMYGLAPGPHRLIQVQRDDDTTEVYYANTREQGSLRKVIDDPTGEQRPVTGF